MSLDYTLNAYKSYLEIIREKYLIITFKDYFLNKPSAFCILRHDVDRWPKNAFKMAVLENEMGVKSTYYFRAKSHTIKPQIIQSISKLGHDIGYHYESLSDTNGNYEKALKDFESNLNKLRTISPIETICMHGQPLKKIDNRDLWKIEENHKQLKTIYKILGEVYLDINYRDILYISDTGRNWHTSKSNIRDIVDSKLSKNFNSKKELQDYLRNNKDKKLIFQTHPERWGYNIYSFTRSFTMDLLVNAIKRIL